MFGMFSKAESINVNEINNLDKSKVIDIREPNEYKYNKIKGVKNIPMNTLLANPNNFMNKEDTYYIMCQSGMRSSSTCKKLTSAGYKVINLKGGINSYKF